MTIEEELEKKREFAVQHGYTLDEERSRILIDKLINKTDGVCPCKTFRAKTVEDKIRLTCPCVECTEEVAKNGKCTCGMFLK